MKWVRAIGAAASLGIATAMMGSGIAGSFHHMGGDVVCAASGIFFGLFAFFLLMPVKGKEQ